MVIQLHLAVGFLSWFPLLGLQMMFQSPKECQFGLYPLTDNCTMDYCHNGGTCEKDDWGEISCKCLPGFDGPRCQATHHSFDGKSYGLYDPMEQCEEGRTSLYIITKQENGLILYNGPTSDPEPGVKEPTDFISLELSGGYPRLKIDHGSGILELYVAGKDISGKVKMQKLSDGRWHRIDIVRKGPEVALIVDHCEKADIGPDYTVKDDKICRAAGIRLGEIDKTLNISTVLQIGGRFSNPSYPPRIMETKFNGCVKNFRHNGRLYDLTITGNPSYPYGANRCTREDVICGENSQGGPVCGDNGICESTWQPDTTKCICKPGYMGSKCSEDATTKNLEKDSFIQWRLKESFFNILNSRKMNMSMMFRTRDFEGMLWKVSTVSDIIFVTLQIINGRLTLTYNLGDGIRNLELYNRNVSNGAWHATVVERNGGEFILKMDNGEGPNYNFTYGYPTDKQDMYIENTILAGANVSFVESVPVLSSDLEETCVRDIRMNNEWLPMEVSENSKSNSATLSKTSDVEDGCIRDDCDSKAGVCPSHLICYPLWGTYECRCKEHFEIYDNVCMPIDYCAKHQCSGSAKCEIDYDDKKNYVCQCPSQWQGEFCSIMYVSCFNHNCSAGATCIDDDSKLWGYSCVCPPGLGGDLCQSSTSSQRSISDGQVAFISLYIPFLGLYPIF